jgi:hypothetical protein
MPWSGDGPRTRNRRRPGVMIFGRFLPADERTGSDTSAEAQRVALKLDRSHPKTRR